MKPRKIPCPSLRWASARSGRPRPPLLPRRPAADRQSHSRTVATRGVLPRVSATARPSLPHRSGHRAPGPAQEPAPVPRAPLRRRRVGGAVRPDLLGLSDRQIASLNDDRVGRVSPPVPERLRFPRPDGRNSRHLGIRRGTRPVAQRLHHHHIPWFHHELDMLINNLQQTGIVVLLGAVGEQRVLEGLRAAHLFVLASHCEPLGVAIMEAMSCETPVIATNSGGVPELIEHGLDGVLIPPKDPSAIADAIRYLAHNPTVAEQFSVSGRSKIIQRFNPNVSATELYRLLKEM